MIKQGRVKDMKEAFSKYLAQGGLAYVQKEGLTPHMAVQLLKEIPLFFLSSSQIHFKRRKRNFTVNTRIKNIGLNAIEANYAGFKSYEIRKYRSWAKTFDLLVTGGSDFHGSNRKILKSECKAWIIVNLINLGGNHDCCNGCSGNDWKCCRMEIK